MTAAALQGRPERFVVARAVIALLALLLAWRFGLFLADMGTAILYPFELDYGEGIVWQQADMLFAGKAYGDITRYPFVVFHYPPVYLTAVKSLTLATGADMLLAGRAVSAAASLFIFGTIAWLATRTEPGPDALALGAGAIAAAFASTCIPLLYWAPLMRVDMLALAFSFGGIAAGIAAFRREHLVHLASLCFVLALFTKQTSLAAPAALYGVMLLARPRLALAGIGSAVAMGLALLVPLALATEGGFLRHIFLYNVNRFELGRLIDMAGRALGTALPLLAVMLWLTFARARTDWWRLTPGARLASLRDALEQSVERRVFLVLLGYLTAAALVALTAGKSGSNINYFNELICVALALLGIGLRDLARAAFTKPLACAIVVPLLTAAALAAPSAFHASRIARLPSLESQRALVEHVSAQEKPVLSDDITILRRAGRQMPWEPAIFLELASTGAWDERPFIEMIRKQRFAFVYTFGYRQTADGRYHFDPAYTPAVTAAIRAAYPVEKRFGAVMLRYPE